MYVSVFIHEIEYFGTKQNKKGVAFLTEGLYSKGQKELFFVLVNNDNFEIPDEVLDFFMTIYQVSIQGRIVNAYGTTVFKEIGLLGMMGIVYTDIPNYLKLTFPSPTLNMILFSRPEVELIEAHGTLRLLSMIGRQYEIYPYPYWTDLNRKELMVDYVKEKSILERIGARARWVKSSVFVTRQENEITLQMSKDFNESVERTIMHELENCCILTSLDSKSDGCFTVPLDSMNLPQAITPPNSQAEIVSGCFLLLVSGQEKYDARIG